MESKIWRATGEYDKKNKTFVFAKELIADKESHVKEKIYSDLGSRHRVKRREIRFEKIEEIEPDELTDLDLRRLLGVEAEF
jgi:large subunit ribosomal protein LX